MAISVRITDINPDDMDIEDLFKMIKAYKNAIMGMVAQLHPDFDLKTIIFSLISIRDKSTEAVIESNYLSLVEASSEQINHDIDKKDFSRTPEPTRNALKEIGEVIQGKRCHVEFYPDANNRKVKAKLTPEIAMKLQPRKAYKINGSTTLFGELITIGGAEPGCKIRLTNGDLFSQIKLGMSLAKELSQRLYETVSLRGIGTWDSNTLELVKFEVKEVLPYHKIPTGEAIKKIRAANPSAWADIENISNAISDMR